MALEQAERDLRRAQHILEHQGGGYSSDEWLLLASLVGEADLAIRQDPSAAPDVKLLLAEVVASFREATIGFTDPAFLRGSRPARRRNKQLFSGGA